jgi:regulator of PEP synthase PpsR (kinase-PPPase family)
MEPQRLRRPLLARAVADNIAEEPYVSLTQVRQELVFARQWQVIDAPSGSVEEVAQEIISFLKSFKLPKE